jgi:hypothetical protein
MGVRLRVKEVMAPQVERDSTLRSSHREALEQEFGRLRKTYEQHAGPQRGADRVRFGNGARARWNLYLFLLANRGVPLGRWTDFLRFIGQERLNVRTKYPLWHIVPASLRPSTLSFIEVYGYGGHSEC